MTLSEFIESNVDAIVAAWTDFARSLSAARGLSKLALEDHAREILSVIALDMKCGQSEAERADKSKGDEAPARSPTAAATHGAVRQADGFDLVELISEFRALRASVLTLWRQSQNAAEADAAIEEIARFNEAIDQSLAESVERYSAALGSSRDMLLAVLGHDLRGPLGVIRTSNHALTLARLSETARQQATTRIARASEKMSGLITDLLDFTRSRLGSGIPIERVDADLRRLCHEELDAIEASYPSLRLESRFSGDLRMKVDASRMRQVLSNLLHNAVQHGDPAAPVTLLAEGEERVVVLTVRNAGRPIPEKALRTIFEPLIQAPREAALEPDERSKTSLGLGLFIVRQIVLGHQGTIGVESEASAGTAFTIRLPREPAPVR